MHAWLRAVSAILGFVLVSTPGSAHPHIWINARAAIIFNDDGELSAIHNRWTFDDAYSAWVVEGLDANHDGKLSRAELQPFANDSMKNLADYGYYTTAGEDEHDIAFLNGDQAVGAGVPPIDSTVKVAAAATTPEPPGIDDPSGKTGGVSVETSPCNCRSSGRHPSTPRRPSPE